jgi:SAM-dependent methyltransferase
MFRKFLYGICSLIPSRTSATPLGVGQRPGKKIPPREPWDRSNVTPHGSYQHPPLGSALCRQRDFDTPWFREWVRRFATPMRYHRGLWEWVYVSEALRERGVLSSESRGLGFGVGAEPLPAAYASFGCRITATDLPLDEASKKGWAGGVQYAGRKEGLKNNQICPEEQFSRLVDFRHCNMSDIPSDLDGFDFCWSCCALEHLRSLDAGIRFVKRSLDTLRPGGWAVHTTEFNMSSNAATIESGPTVLYRQCDLKQLIGNLQNDGNQIAQLDLTPGDQILDGFVDLPPYELWEPHLKLAIEGYTCTSVAIIVQKGIKI